MSIVADVSWRERYVSHALNRKFAGVIPTGIYQGFECAADSSGNVTVGAQGGDNTAVAEVGNHSVTIRMDEPETVKASAGEPYVVIAPYYAVGAPTRVSLKAVSAPEGGQVVLGRFNSDSGTMDNRKRQVAMLANLDATLTRMATAHVESMHRHLRLRKEAVEGIAAAREESRKALEESNNSRDIALTKAATATIDTMARQVSMMGRLLELENASAK